MATIYQLWSWNDTHQIIDNHQLEDQTPCGPTKEEFRADMTTELFPTSTHYIDIVILRRLQMARYYADGFLFDTC